MRYLKAYFEALRWFLCFFGAIFLIISAFDQHGLYFIYLSVVGAFAGPIKEALK